MAFWFKKSHTLPFDSKWYLFTFSKFLAIGSTHHTIISFMFTKYLFQGICDFSNCTSKMLNGGSDNITIWDIIFILILNILRHILLLLSKIGCQKPKSECSLLHSWLHLYSEYLWKKILWIPLYNVISFQHLSTEKWPNDLKTTNRQVSKGYWAIHCLAI